MSVNSANNNNYYYLSTSIAQQKVASDRADILETETQLDQEKAVLDNDLTYLGNVQRKTQTVQKLENTQAQTNAYDKVVKTAQVAKQATQQALSYLVAATTPDSALGTNVNVFA
jgi:cyclophilin family peptidyl-prolyl cis-trans isomerase